MSTRNLPSGSSRWDTLPAELRLHVLYYCTALYAFLHGKLAELGPDTVLQIWCETIRLNWQGDLRRLPDVSSSSMHLVLRETMPVCSRSMYRRLCARFPLLSDSVTDIRFDARTNYYSLNAKFCRMTSGASCDRLRHIPMRNCWLDNLDMTHPIALGWQAIMGGHVDLLSHLVQHHNVQLQQYQFFDNEYAMNLAAFGGHVGILQMLHDAGNTACTTRAMDVAAKQGHLETLVWLHEHGYSCTTHAMDGAASAGHVAVIAWLCQHRRDHWTTDAMDSAASNGHLDVLMWMHEHCQSARCTTQAMDKAAGRGHLSVVRWLHANRPEGCTTQAMDLSATNNHLDVVQWLHAHRTEGCTTRAMDGACKNGHGAVVRWLRDHRTEGCSRETIMTAAWQGHLDLVNVLVSTVRPPTAQKSVMDRVRRLSASRAAQ